VMALSVERRIEGDLSRDMGQREPAGLIRPRPTEPIRACGHRPRPQAGHMTASDLHADTRKNPCEPGAIHTCSVGLQPADYIRGHPWDPSTRGSALQGESARARRAREPKRIRNKSLRFLNSGPGKQAITGGRKQIGNNFRHQRGAPRQTSAGIWVHDTFRSSACSPSSRPHLG
jgi:hypothetical protein